MNQGPEFLSKLYHLHESDEVKKAVAKERHKNGDEDAPKEASEQTETYLNRIEHILDDESGSSLLESMIVKDYVLDISDEELVSKLAHDLYNSEKQIAINRGQGDQIEQLDDTEILKRYKREIFEKAEIQKQTLGSWINYLKANDADYPMWFRYYVMRSLKNMGAFDRDTRQYTGRNEDTVAPFPEMNAEALAFVHTSLIHQLEKEKTSLSPQEVLTILEIPNKKDRKKAKKDLIREKKRSFEQKYLSDLPLDEGKKDELTRELLKALQGKDFSKLYAFAQVETAGNIDREQIAGEWVTYDQGSDYTKLEEALKNKGTGWCTATGAAKGQLENGDFYVYYSYNKAGEPTEPRIAIRMQGNEIGEIRGIDKQQEMEPEMVDIAKEKYKDLPGAEKYEKADHDMKLMTQIYDKHQSGEELTKTDLRFLYELDSKIEGFGYADDPRVKEILDTRNVKEDLANLFNTTPDRISTTKEEALSGDIVYHYGALRLDGLTSAEGLTLPESIGGFLSLNDLTSADNLQLPESIGGFLSLNGLTSADNLQLPESIGVGLSLNGLTSADNLQLPESIDGDLYLNGLTSADNLQLPESIGGFLDLSSLTSADNLQLPESIGGGLYLYSLRSADKQFLRKKFPHLADKI